MGVTVINIVVIPSLVPCFPWIHDLLFLIFCGYFLVIFVLSVSVSFQENFLGILVARMCYDLLGVISTHLMARVTQIDGFPKFCLMT